MRLSSEWIAQAVGGTLHGSPADVTGQVVTDSRLATPGSLYVARRGENSDGHDYIAAAANNGAVLTLVEYPVDVPIAQIVVEDSTYALGELARTHLAQLRAQGILDVIAVTGSAGKTTTKDLLAQIMAADAPTVAPRLSFNNEVGLPLTVMEADENTRHLVLEMGASGPGHIDYLTRIAPPDVAIELMVGHAHLGGFGSVEGIARAKAELIHGLVPGGITLLNADDDLVMGMRADAPGEVRTFSAQGKDEATYRAENIRLDEAGHPSFTLVAGGEGGEIRLNLVGIHHVSNALAAIAGAHTLGLPLTHIIESLNAATALSPHRMDVRELRVDGHDITLIDDSYNANIDSFRAGVAAARALAHERPLIVVAGEMLELGEATRATHREVASFFTDAHAQAVITLGECAVHYAEGLADGITHTHVRNVDEAYAELRRILEDRSVVFIKGSLYSNACKVADQLMEEGRR